MFSNYADGLLTWGKEEVVKNYIELSEDPKGESYRVHLIQFETPMIST